MTYAYASPPLLSLSLSSPFFISVSLSLYLSLSFQCAPIDHLMIVASAYTFLYVPCDPLVILANTYTFIHMPWTFRIHSSLFWSRPCPGVMRSYTFRTTLSWFLRIVLRSDTFLIRSMHIPPLFLLRTCPKVIHSYTFRATSLAILTKTNPYVPMRSETNPLPFKR